MEDMLQVGVVTTTHGVRGEVKESGNLKVQRI